MTADDNITQQGGQVQGNKPDTPRLLQTSLQNTASIYQKQFNHEDWNDLLNRLKNFLEELKDIAVGKVLLENQNVKWYITVTLDFHKGNDSIMQTEPQVTFRMEVFTSFHIDVMYPAVNMLLQ